MHNLCFICSVSIMTRARSTDSALDPPSTDPSLTRVRIPSGQIPRDAFEMASSRGIETDLETHVAHEHNPEHYIFLRIYLMDKDPNSYTGQEQYVQKVIRHPPSAINISNPPSAIRHQHQHQQSAISHQPSAISNQPSAISHQSGAARLEGWHAHSLPPSALPPPRVLHGQGQRAWGSARIACVGQQRDASTPLRSPTHPYASLRIASAEPFGPVAMQCIQAKTIKFFPLKKASCLDLKDE